MSKLVRLDENTPSIRYLCKKDKRFQKVFSMIGSISYELQEDGYSFLIHEIIEQMLSAKAANAIYGRLKELCGGSVCPDIINSLSDEQILSIGTSRAKVKAIRSLTQKIENGNIVFSEFDNMTDTAVLHILTRVHGIGMWTAKMYLLFVLDRQDILPFEDIAFLQGYGWTYKTDDYSPAAVKKKCGKWKPYSSIAARYMYLAVDKGLTKKEFHLFE